MEDDAFQTQPNFPANHALASGEMFEAEQKKHKKKKKTKKTSNRDYKDSPLFGDMETPGEGELYPERRKPHADPLNGEPGTKKETELSMPGFDSPFTESSLIQSPGNLLMSEKLLKSPESPKKRAKKKKDKKKHKSKGSHDSPHRVEHAQETGPLNPLDQAATFSTLQMFARNTESSMQTDINTCDRNEPGSGVSHNEAASSNPCAEGSETDDVNCFDEIGHTGRRKKSRKKLTRFQRQQMEVMRLLGAIQDDDYHQEQFFGSSHSTESGHLILNQGDRSTGDSFVSDLTSENSQGSLGMDQRLPQYSRTGTRTSHVATKEAIMEDYEYDQASQEIQNWETLGDMVQSDDLAHLNAHQEQPSMATATGEDQRNHELLVMYLLSMGADEESAQRIAESFEAQRTKYGPPSSRSTDAVDHGSQRKYKGTFAHLPRDENSEGQTEDAQHQEKARMFFDRSSSRSNIRLQLHSESSQRRSRGSLVWTRYNEPGAVQVSQRAYGAPLRPPIPSSSEGALPESNGDSPVVAELVEEKDDFSLDPETGETGRNNVIIAESAPLSFRTVLRERSIRRAFIAASLVVVTIIAVSLGVTLTSGAANAGSGNEGSQSYIEKFPTSSPTLSPTRIDDGFIDILSGVSSWESLTTPGTPQFQAMVWLSTFDVSAVEPTDPRFLQRYALVVIYFASGGGKSWLEDENWLEPTLHECDWGPSTIECRQDSALSRIVSSLDLTRNGLAGSLPPEVGILTGLETFKASKNNLKGEIPEQLFRLSSLVTLEMGLNSLSGSIPRSIINATELEYLDMSNNQLASTLPIQLFRLFNLRWLDLSSNLITGTLSTELGQLKLITSINFQHNLLTGGIPNAFDDLPDLDFILLDDNLISGPLPSWSSALLTRQELTIGHNLITGSVPDNFDLSADGNSLSIIRLKKVDLSFNRLNGTIPILGGLIPSLRWLDISGNDFVGTVPTGATLWPSMEHLAARKNRLAGTIPHVFPTSLRVLDLSENQFEFGVPVELAAFPALEFLSLNNNPTSGSIPDQIARMPSLKVFQVRNCSLTGQIPSGFAFSAAEILDIGLNYIGGTIPESFGDVATLKELSLDGNQLSGRIPSELGLLDQLKTLALNNNILTGQLPSVLGNLSNLESFVIANNQLSGNVPPQLCSSLPNLSASDIGCNIICDCCQDQKDVCGLP